MVDVGGDPGDRDADVVHDGAAAGLQDEGVENGGGVQLASAADLGNLGVAGEGGVDQTGAGMPQDTAHRGDVLCGGRAHR